MVSARIKFRLLVGLLLALAGCSREGRAPLVIFHADSLSAYVTALAQEFERSHPGVKVHHEGSGSLDAIRKLTDLHRSCDIIMTADWRLLDDRLREALDAGPTMILLDNMSVGQVREAVRIAGDRAELEASGGITLENARVIAETGVHRMSVGALTKDVRAADFSMRFEK